MSLIKEKIELGIQETEFKIEQKLNFFSPLVKWSLVICVLGALPAYYLAKQISYSISKKNLRNMLVEARPSFKNPLLPKIVKTEVFNWSPNTYSVLAQIENQNIELSSQNIGYKFVFYGENGAKITPESGSTTGSISLVAGKKQYLALPKIQSTKKILKAEAELDPQIMWQRRLNVPQVKLFTTVPEFQNFQNPSEFRVTGFVENSNQEYEFGRVKILLLVKDSAGKILTISERSEFSLKSKERRSYTQIWPNINFNNAASVEALAETDVLDPANLKTSASNSEADSDLDRPEIKFR